jgi:membrane associated rhomboid family serine protease
MLVAPVLLLLLLLLVVALLAPLVPVRRRRQAGLAGFPAVTAALLVANIVCFAGSLDAEGRLRTEVVRAWGLTPEAPSVVTLLTHMFLHGSWLHLIGNMLGLWLFGPHVEEALGRLEYLLFYVGAGVAAGLLHLLIADTLLPAAAHAPLVGASGAIFGVLGLFAVRFWRARVRVFLIFSVPAVWAVGVFAALQVFNGVLAVADGGASDNTANWAHVGGFLFGALIALPLQMKKDSAKEYGLEDAVKAEQAGRLDEAASHYRTVLTLTPDDADAHHALARVCVQMRQGEAAYRHFMDALRLYIRAGNGPATARVFHDAAESFESLPLTAHFLQRIASACEEAGQYTLAMRALSDLCRDHPDAREAEMSMIRLGKLHLHKLNQPKNAIGVFSEFLRLYPASEWSAHALRLRDEAERASAPFSR